MGDADTEISVPVHVIETWLDEALEEMDEGLDQMFNFIDNISKQTSQVMTELKSWEKFRRCFTALNLFVIPIVVAICIAYTAREPVGKNSEMAASLEPMVTFLMYLSGTIGLPLYIFTLWDAYFAEPNYRTPPSKRGRSVTSEMSNFDARVQQQESLIPLSVFEGGAAEQFAGLGRRVSRRIIDNVLRRVSQASEFGRTIESPENTHAEGIPEADVEESSFVNSYITDTSEVRQSFPETTHKSGKDCCGVKVIILNTTPDMSVEIEKTEEILTETDRQIGSRTITEKPQTDYRSFSLMESPDTQETIGRVQEQNGRIELADMSFKFVKDNIESGSDIKQEDRTVYKI